MSRAPAFSGLVLVCAATTLAVALTPALRFAYFSPSLHLVLETVAAFAALLTSFLVYGRFRASGSASDLCLLTALIILGCANLLFSVVPLVVSPSDTFRSTAWAVLVTRAIGSALLALAPFLSARPVAEPEKALRRGVIGASGLFAVVALATAQLSTRLPLPVPPHLLPVDAGGALIIGHPVALALQAAGVLFFAAAALGFARRSTHDPFKQRLVVACVLGAFARLNYFLFPSLYSKWVYVGDGFRLAFHLVLLYAVLHEIESYWSRLRDYAIEEERRRIARDLHDGLAQEIAFISSHAQGAVQAAAQRALRYSRLAIDQLSRSESSSVSAAIVRAATVTAARGGIALHLDLGRDDIRDRGMAEHLAAIVSESITNAQEHGGATEVRVACSLANGVDLRISDNGSGLAAESPSGHRGLGLESIFERTKSLRGRLRVRSVPGTGLEISVRCP